jgi:hypothetical protein
MLFKALKSSSLIIAAARGVRATPNAQPAIATPEIKEDIFMIIFEVDSVSAVFLEIFEDFLRLRRGEVGPHPHVQHDGFPLGRREFGGVALGMAACAIDGVQLGAGFGSVFLSGSACARTALRHAATSARAPASTTRRLFVSVERIKVLLSFVTCHNVQPVSVISIHIICFCYSNGALAAAMPK